MMMPAARSPLLDVLSMTMGRRLRLPAGEPRAPVSVSAGA